MPERRTWKSEAEFTFISYECSSDPFPSVYLFNGTTSVRKVINYSALSVQKGKMERGFKWVIITVIVFYLKLPGANLSAALKIFLYNLRPFKFNLETVFQSIPVAAQTFNNVPY